MPDPVTNNCPVISDILASQECTENFAGLGSTVYIFLKEDLRIELVEEDTELTDGKPRYDNELDTVIGDCYLNNTYVENISVYRIFFWSDEECNDHFLQFIDEIEELRLFIRDYFLGVEEDISFFVTQDYPPVRLNDEKIYNYLNYNTNL